MVRRALLDLLFGALGAGVALGLALRLGLVSPQVMAVVDLTALVETETRRLLDDPNESNRRDAARLAGERVQQAIEQTLAGRREVVVLREAVLTPDRLPDLTPEVRQTLEAFQ